MAEVYQIRIREHVNNCWVDRFEGFHFVYEEDGATLLVGPVADQAALHGLLARVRDLGLTLLSVNQLRLSKRLPDERACGPDPATSPPSSGRQNTEAPTMDHGRIDPVEFR